MPHGSWLWSPGSSRSASSGRPFRPDPLARPRNDDGSIAPSTRWSGDELMSRADFSETCSDCAGDGGPPDCRGRWPRARNASRIVVMEPGLLTERVIGLAISAGPAGSAPE